MASSSSTSEWQTGADKVLYRKLRGAELLVNYSEQLQNGNYQLTFSALLDTSLRASDLRRRIRKAWWRTRLLHPVIAVELIAPSGGLDIAAMRPIERLEDATSWNEQTCFLVTDGSSVKEVADSCSSLPMSSPGKQATLHLVLEPRIGLPGLVLNISHVLSGHHGLKILETCVEQLSVTSCESLFAEDFTRETVQTLQARLPMSTVEAYRRNFNPTQQQLDEARAVATHAAARFAKQTIGAPIREDCEKHSSRTHSPIFTFNADDTAKLLKALKHLGLSLTSAFYACICSAIAQEHFSGTEKGAHLLFSAHARRWLSTEGEGGRPPVSMAIVPGAAWIDAGEEELKADTRDGLVHLAKKITLAQEADISSPHILGILDELAATALSSAAASTSATDSSTPTEAIPAIGRPTFTSQGIVDMKRNILGTSESHIWIRIADWFYQGRNTDPVVCFAAHLYRRQLRYQVLFDEKFFDVAETSKLAVRVGNLFRRFILDSETARL